MQQPCHQAAEAQIAVGLSGRTDAPCSQEHVQNSNWIVRPKHRERYLQFAHLAAQVTNRGPGHITLTLGGRIGADTGSTNTVADTPGRQRSKWAQLMLASLTYLDALISVSCVLICGRHIAPTIIATAKPHANRLG